MKILKRSFATLVLAVALCASAYAGDVSIPVGGAAPGDIEGPGSAPAPCDGISTRCDPYRSYRGLLAFAEL
jgi:hypothetical protein